MEDMTYKVYALLDEAGRIIATNSSAFLLDTKGWQLIDKGIGDKYHHAQGNYLPSSLTDDRGVYCYKLENGKPVERSQEEMDEDYAGITENEPSSDELLLEMAADHEYRICLIELGVNGNDL